MNKPNTTNQSLMPITCRQNKQKFLIYLLLKYSNLKIEDLASLLDISVQTLQEVGQGHLFLQEQQATHLLNLVVICFCD